jgi:molybdate transport system substrate-binding protein
MRIYAFLFILICLFSGGCRTDEKTQGRNSGGGNITVSAAVSLKDAFTEIGKLYESKTGNTVSFNFGASGALQRQIETGAPVDLFASAGERQMDELARKNLIDKSSRRDFARNRIVLVGPKDSKIPLSFFSDLTKDEVKKIAVGNPKTVPAGQYTEQTFNNLNLNEKLAPKLIFAEDVRQVLDYVVRGEVDAGVVYATDARIAGEKVRLIATAEENTHDPIRYPLAVVKDSAKKKTAREFAELVSGAEGQKILQKYGFSAIS